MNLVHSEMKVEYLTCFPDAGDCNAKGQRNSKKVTRYGTSIYVVRCNRELEYQSPLSQEGNN